MWVLIADLSLASTVGNGPEERGKLGMREEMDITEKQKEHPGPFGMYVLLQNKRRGSDRWKVERRVCVWGEGGHPSRSSAFLVGKNMFPRVQRRRQRKNQAKARERSTGMGKKLCPEC